MVYRLCKSIDPFERQNISNINNPPRQVAQGESDSFDEIVIIFTPSEVSYLVTPIEGEFNFDYKYLWIIDELGQLLLVLENTPILASSRKVVCHSNITKGGKALQVGELWFLNDLKVALNFKLGRYGADTKELEDAVIQHFELLGFEVQTIDN